MYGYEDPIVTEIQNAVRFPVDVQCEDFPDVIFHIFFEKPADMAMAKVCTAALQRFMNTYNITHLFRPIHYVSDVEDLPDAPSAYAVSIHMDFGNANPKGLIGAVKAVAATVLPIRRIILE